MHERDDWEADDWEAAFSATEPDEDTSGYDDYDYEPIAPPTTRTNICEAGTSQPAPSLSPSAGKAR